MVSDIIILAGGAGTRLWPASVKGHPKQFMALSDIAGGSSRSFMSMALERALALEPEGEILVVTNQAQSDLVVDACAALPEAARSKIVVLGEPRSRNTAPAVALATAWLAARGRPQARSALLMTSDHLILPLAAFVEDARKATALADDDYLVCMGIRPKGPSTGYGYIEAAGVLGAGLSVASFREKPDVRTAKGFVEAGNYFWNSGMYVFGLDFIREQLHTHAPAITEAFKTLQGQPVCTVTNAVRVLNTWEGLAQAYDDTPSVSLDYAVSEHCPRVAMVPASFEWHDVGSFEELAALFPQLDTALAEPQSSGCWVYADVPVVLCGVEDLMVVVKHGCVLVARKGAGQLVKQAVETIQAKGLDKLL
jgi:mannose-1-phosphate guanylyltransferase/mannose-6-phosphate isomerase